MSRGYVPKETAGCLLIAGAISSVEAAYEDPSRPDRDADCTESTPVHSSNSGGMYSKLRLILPHTQDAIESMYDLEVDGDGDMMMGELEFDTDRDAEISRTHGFSSVPPIPRQILRHPDEKTFIQYLQLEQKVLTTWTSMEAEDVDFNMALCLVTLANECFEVARESYRISRPRFATNYFQQSLTWPNAVFRRLYRLDSSRVMCRLNNY